MSSTTMIYKMYRFLILSFLFILAGQARAADDFQTPPEDCRPWVYWFFMDGNQTKEGMTADLEAMKRAGIGGVIMMEVNLGVPRNITGKPVDFMSGEWIDNFVYAVRECERLGLQLTLNSGPGWTGSGGPWIKPEQSMLHLTVSETVISTENNVSCLLNRPQPRKPFFGEGQLPAQIEKERKEWFQDVCVLAVKLPPECEKIKDIDEKALYYRAPYSSQPGVKPRIPDPAVSEGEGIQKVIDITDCTKNENGELFVDIEKFKQKIPPQAEPEDWKILRFAATSTGQNTRPAPQPGLGLECSKMDREFFDVHWNNYVAKLLEATQKNVSGNKNGGWKYLHIDSWEMGSANYSKNFLAEFEKRRGYNPKPYLPAYAGYVVQTPEITERFLWDVRQTAQELTCENHGQYLKESAHKNGLQLSIEPYDMMPCCDMTFGSIADVPMCEFWSANYGYNSEYSVWEAASIAHLYGKPVVAAEAFTSSYDKWRQNPKSMKLQGDWAFSAGINRFVFHRFAHQPFQDKKPGFSMGIHGVHWERTQTWWELSKSYHEYLTRCNSMLRKGRAAADILYLEPEGAPQVFTPPVSAFIDGKRGFMEDQKGYRFDGCDPNTFINGKWKVENGELVPEAENATRYKMLVLPDVETMTPQLLKKLLELTEQGLTVIGNVPQRSPSLQNYPQCDEEVRRLAAVLAKRLIQYDSKNGELYPPYELTAKILQDKNIPLDVEVENSSLRFFHRIDAGRDIYFLANKTDKPFDGKVKFRTTKKHVSLWYPLTGQVFKLLDCQADEKQTEPDLFLDGSESVFVIFDDSGTSLDAEGFNAERYVKPQYTTIADLSSNWNVSFEGKDKYFDTLTDWAEHNDTDVKYFSGTAVYKKTVDIPAAVGTKRVFLDLGNAEVIARVKINGKDIGTRWCGPYRFDITELLPDGGQLNIEIEVANLWTNQLIGDASAGGKPRSWSTWNQPYKADDKLLPSGLLGPVKIVE